jgi:phage regulator Rha-like protein
LENNVLKKLIDKYINYGINISMTRKLAKIQSLIYEIRGQKVMLDRDLAELYNVELKVMNQAVKRNIERFPSDFMFHLTQNEWNILRSQIVTANENISKVRYRPNAFTEHGVLMLSNVLNSTKAINMSIQIIRVFDKLRKYILEQTSKDIRIEDLHKLLMLHIENNHYKFSEHEKAIEQIVYALNNLMALKDQVQPKKAKTIGFNAGNDP